MVAVFVAAACSWLFLYALIPQLRRRLIDQPNARSSHLEPTPRGGGISFVAVSSVFSGIALLSGQGFAVDALPLIAAPLAVVGLLDDCHNLPATWRYGFQLITATFMLGFSPLVHRFGLAVVFGNWLLLLVLALLVIAVTAVVNFTNFMDGLDGLVAGCMAVTIAALAIALAVSWSLWALVGSLLGFLFWNWGPAKVFMGDVGSTFLGAVFAGLVLQASSWPEALGYLLWPLPWEMLVFVSLAVGLLASACSSPTVFIFSSVCIRRAGLTPAFPSPTSLLQQCWRWQCLREACPGCLAWLFWRYWLGCGLISMWPCPLLWPRRSDGFFLIEQRICGFAGDLQAASTDRH